MWSSAWHIAQSVLAELTWELDSALADRGGQLTLFLNSAEFTHLVYYFIYVF